MRKATPKYKKNNRVEFMLRDDLSESGYSHHVGYIKRAVTKKRLFRRDIVFYCICEAKKEIRSLWCNVPEKDILGIVEIQKKDTPIEIKEPRTYKDFGEMKELINNKG